MTVVAYISVGSNLNNPYQQVKSAIGKLKIADNIYIETISGWYLSDPVGPKNQSHKPRLPAAAHPQPRQAIQPKAAAARQS